MDKSVPPAVAGGLTRSTIKPGKMTQVYSVGPAARIQPPATAGGSDWRNACAAAVDELKASRTLIAALDAELATQRTRLDTERQLNAVLTELSSTRKSESAALTRAVEAKNETIAAKDAVIASQDKLIAELKAKRPSTWRRIGDILLGVGVMAVLK